MILLSILCFFKFLREIFLFSFRVCYEAETFVLACYGTFKANYYTFLAILKQIPIGQGFCLSEVFEIWLTVQFDLMLKNLIKPESFMIKTLIAQN